jgi:sugar lactone lactonase YvrE
MEVDELGEGPVWDERRGELLRVDIPRGLVHGWDPVSGRAWRREYDGEVSAVVPRASGEGFVVACGRRLILDDGTPLAEVQPGIETNRLNDCKCDPQGRLWAGTMSKPRVPGAAALYRLDPGEPPVEVIGATTISNGLDWSPGGELMYFVDSPTQRIDVLDFDGATGAVSNRRPLAHVEPEDGLPDGLTVDAEGGVWVCLFGGGAIRRYDASGRLDEVLELPMDMPTSAAFGGTGLSTLFVTGAGPLLALEPGVGGRLCNRFGG